MCTAVAAAFLEAAHPVHIGLEIRILFKTPDTKYQGKNLKVFKSQTKVFVYFVKPIFFLKKTDFWRKV